MAETPGEGTAPLHVNIEEAKTKTGRETSYGTILDMYSNLKTGELVQMCWVDASQAFPGDQLSLDGGEELFILDGSLQVEGGEEYGKWGWLRFPVGSDDKREKVMAGSEGARVFRKTGHLTEAALSMEKIQIEEEN